MGFLSSLFGFGGDKPKTQQVVQATKLPEEIAPFAKEVLDEAKALYTQRMGEGYTPYEGPTIAPLTSEQEQAMAGISGLVGTQRPLQEEALDIFRTGATEKFTPEVAQEYMSPYQRAVTDVEKREAQRDFESRIMPAFEKQAVGAGGMSGMGSRAGVQAAQLGKTQMERLGDIEAKGLQSAYRDAQNLWGQQQQRERAAAGDIGKLAPAIYGSGIAELGALQTVGEQKQALGQEALDEAYFRHLEKQAYPQEQLAGYSGFVYGNPLMQQRTRTTTMPAPVGPSMGQQLMGLGLGAAKLYGMGGGGTQATGGPGFNWAQLARSFGKTGGRISARTGGGLSSLPVVYRQQNAEVLSPEDRAIHEDRAKRRQNIRERIGPWIADREDRRDARNLSTDISRDVDPDRYRFGIAPKVPREMSRRNLLNLQHTWRPNYQGVLDLLESMGVGIEDLFEKRRESVGHPKFGLGAAMAGVLETPGGRQPGLIEAGLRGLGAGFEVYDEGVAKRAEELSDIEEAEDAFRLKMALKGAEPFEGKYTDVARKSLLEHAVRMSGEKVRFELDPLTGRYKLFHTSAGQSLTPAVQQKIARLVQELENAFALFYTSSKNEIEALARAKNYVSGNRIPSDNLAEGDNQNTTEVVTSTPGQLKPETLDQTAPGVSSNQPVENDLDHIPTL